MATRKTNDSLFSDSGQEGQPAGATNVDTNENPEPKAEEVDTWYENWKANQPTTAQFVETPPNDNFPRGMFD